MTTARACRTRPARSRRVWPLLRSGARWMAAALERARQRRALQRLDDRLLRDIGLTRRDIER